MRKVLIIPTSLLLFFAACYTGYWFWAASTLKSGLENWKGVQEEKGYDVRYRADSPAGFPFDLILTLEETVLNSPSGWLWQAAGVELKASPLDLSELTLTTFGTQSIAIRPLSHGAQNHVRAADSRVRVVMGRDGKAIEANGTLFDFIDQNRNGINLRGRELRFAFRQQESQELAASPETAHFTLYAGDISFPNLNALFLGKDLRSLELEGDAHEGLPQELSPQAFDLWRERGGYIEISRLETDWQPLKLSASGKLELDSERRLSGNLDVWWQNLPGLVDKATAAGLIRQDAVLPLKLGLLALPSRSGDDGAEERLLPLVFRSGQIFLGPVAIGRLPPLL
ncbi:MAG: DUF2125 domain-containing protein [Kiloniellales bacterium]|nr:DUF2125 domain-containing protein [Kiloniellales bacterium]